MLSTHVSLRTPEDDAITYLFDYVTNGESDCRKMIVENRYVDLDYMDDFSHYYARCFRKYDRFCRRLHFFTDFDTSSFEGYLAGEGNASLVVKDLQPHYGGFIVARPLPYTIIGRTVLQPWKETVSGLGSEDEPGKRSIRCVREYKVSLAGIPLIVQGLAFQEQDRVIAACATSALWSAFHQTSSLFGHAQPSTYEITSHATRYLVRFRPIPSTGLTVSQMCEAVRALGLEADLKDVQEFDPFLTKSWAYQYPLLSAAYGYLRAGIPVILIVEIQGVDGGDHAVTLVGYRVDEKGPGFDEMQFWSPNTKLKLKGARIISLYAHDDQIGPYSRLQVEAAKGPGNNYILPIQLGSTWQRKTGGPTTLVPYSIILPLYHKIRVPWMSAYLLAEQMQTLIGKPIEATTEIEWDIFLSTVNSYKAEISHRGGISKMIRREILSSPQPRFFWRARAFAGSLEVCEMLIDATDMEHSFQLVALNVFDDALRENLQDVPDETIDLLSRGWRGRSLISFVTDHLGAQNGETSAAPKVASRTDGG